MSYSFHVTATNVEAAKADVESEFDKVVASQPIHAKDKKHAMDTVESSLALLGAQPDGKGVYVSVSGSVGWNPDESLNNVSLNVMTYYANK